jgi:hypothetical protein
MMGGTEMTKAFKASRLMGLIALVFGLMAFSATAAQAELGAKWKVNGATIASNLLPEVQADLENKDGILLTKVGLSKVEILCTSLKYVNGKLHESGRATLKIHFEGCITKLNGTLANACVPHSPGAANGLIETNALKALIKLHEPSASVKIPVVELLPEVAGGSLVTQVLGKAAPDKNECAIGEKFDIKGVLFFEECLGKGETELIVHLTQEQKSLSKLLFGANPATLDGSANNFLAGGLPEKGGHQGLQFSGNPG